MGLCTSQEKNIENDDDNATLGRSNSSKNVHMINPDLIVHTVISNELDFDHRHALAIALGEVSDEQLVAEIANRRLDPHTKAKQDPQSDHHKQAMKRSLGSTVHDDLFTEVVRRNIDIRDKINESVVYETYEMGKPLGKGASGQVYVCRHKGNNKTFACKIIKKDATINDAQSMSTEIEIMKRIRHKNIVAMYELYETPKCLWLILELVDAGDLRGFITRNKGLMWLVSTVIDSSDSYYRCSPFVSEIYNEAMAATHFKQLLEGVGNIFLSSMLIIFLYA